MATRVLPMSARLGPMQQPDEPVFAQLKPVLGAREAAMFTGEDLKQQQPGGGQTSSMCNGPDAQQV
uniref:Uncharacterized protein n=1 Tax=Chrysemys picta bellii TaxID=8478 RepID=A0A8C3ISY6_CHRPI